MKAKTLEAVLEEAGRRPRFVVARLDGATLRKAWPAWTDRRVQGQINGFAFRTTLLSAKKGAELVLLVNRKMQAGAKAGLGDRVHLRLEPDEANGPEVPEELTDALKSERALQRWFAALSPSMRKGIGGYVDQAKSAAKRQERAARMTESLMLAMEGERELPPLLRVAFERAPGAAAGWRAMTPLQRRNHLLGIFYVQTVDGRERRAEKAAEAALRMAERSRRQAH